MRLHEDRSDLAACEAQCSTPRKDMKLRIKPPFFMIGRKISCWRCQTKMPVIALLALNLALNFESPIKRHPVKGKITPVQGKG
jgi:hypothetical protein